ncbi:MAG: ATPase [archaeon]|nr:ATPase [archaeon]
MVLEGVGGIAIGAAIAIAGGAIGTGMAQSAIGAAAMGVIAEKPEQAGKLIIWIAIPETIVIFGFVIAILLALAVGSGVEAAVAAA